MSLQKIAGTRLFDGYQLLGSNKVLLIKDGITEAILEKEDAGEDIQFFSGIVCPGFVNTHCHLELSYLKNTIAQNCGMTDFLLQVMQNRDIAYPILMEAIAQAEKEMITNGIVAVGDICNTTNTIAQKLKSNLDYTNFIEISGFIPATAESRFANGKKIETAFVEKGLSASIVAHAPYSVSDALFRLIENEKAKITSLHYMESKAEVSFLKDGTGDFLKLYKNLGIDISFWKGRTGTAFPFMKNTTGQSNILVHNVTTNRQEIENQKSKIKNLYYCICPNANLYIGNGLPDMEILMHSGVPICIGTDSLSSNTQLSIAAEIKTIKKYFPTVTWESLLQWSTLNGAKALGIDEKYGSFEKGKSGKFTVLDIN